VTGTGWRVSANALTAAQDQSPALRRRLLLYCDNFSLQKSYTAASNARSPLLERLARWLLMAHDRLEGDDIPLTHEILSYMLGTRRPGVTEASHRLVELGVVFSERGRLIVRDRAQLEKLAGRFYGETEKEYRRLVETPSHAPA
jgi:CRP-like cAMP-binding protein